ncbi:hypothetical protein EMN46_03075 [Ancylomarina sp. 16SWW S1-10-2]|nr:hypothetical protein [Ancylomarina sp. 16SWW S1-10-2]
MERIIVVLIIGACACYVFQQITFPSVYFIGASYEWVHKSLTPHRFIQIHGQSLISLGLFFGLNRLLETRKTEYILLIILCFSCLLIRGFRIMLLASIISSCWLIFRYKKRVFSAKYAMYFVLIIGLVFVSLLIPVVNDAITNMISRQSSGQTLDNDDYARTIQFVYYTTEHFHSFVEYFFGSGLPGNSAYGEYISTELPQRAINWVDWGLLGLSWLGGIPLVFFIIRYMVKCIKTKLPRKYHYINAWFCFLLIISLTHPEVYQHNSMVVQAFVLYLFYKIRNEKNRLSFRQ